MSASPRTAITTILFTDLVSSTELMQRVGDESAQRLFQTHHRLLQETVQATGGEELQWLGDGLMAAFASTADAVRCAIAIQQAAQLEPGEERLQVRVGLNAGEILQQESGSDYFGTPVVIARRLCDRAQPGQILCSTTVAGLLSGRQAFRFRDLGACELKGIADPVGVSEVVYEAERSAPVLRRTPFVGRRDEIARLEQLLQRAKSGKGGLAMLVGEPGIGKTRTLEEFAANAREQGAVVLWGSCYEGDWEPPFCPFVEAIRDYAKQCDPGELEKDLGLYGGAIAKLVPELRERIPSLPEPAPLQPNEERHRLLDAVTQFLVTTAQRAPLALVLDDLHWGDRGTIAMLRHLARFAPRHPMLLIGAYRDVELDRQHPLADALAALQRETEYERVLLRGLDGREIHELLETLAAHEVPEALSQAIGRETEGNPFFIRELILHLVEAGKLYRTEGRWQTDFSIEELGLPEGVRQVVGRRLSRLSDEANRLLSAASGFNGVFRFEVARGAAGLEEMTALDALDETLEAQLLRPAGEADVYDFTHALIRYTLYTEMNPSRQVRLHRRIAEELERVHGERVSERAGEIAQQYVRSSVLPGAEQGVPHCLEAAERAQQSAAYEEGAAFLRMALELVPEGDARGPRIQADLGLALAWSLATDEAVAVAAEAGEQLARSEGEDAAADYLAQVVDAVWIASFSPRAWPLAERGLAYAGARRDFTWLRLRAHVLARRDAEDPASPGIAVGSEDALELIEVALRTPEMTSWYLHHWSIVHLAPVRTREEGLQLLGYDPILTWLTAPNDEGIRKSMAELERQAAESLERGQLAEAAMALTIVARFLTSRGELETAQARFARALELADRLPPSPFLALQMSVVPLEQAFVRGESSEAFLPLIEDTLSQSTPELRWVTAAWKSMAAAVNADLGRTEAALRWLADVVPALERAPGSALNYAAMAFLAARTLWSLERTDHLATIERSLLSKVIETDFRYMNTDARLAMAWLRALEGRIDEAREWFARARDMLDEEGSRPLRAQVDLQEARMYARRGAPGDRARALELCDVALAQFEPLGLDGWISRTQDLQRELRQSFRTE